MKHSSHLNTLIACGFAALVLTAPADAFSQAHGHSFTSPAEMKWADVPSLPPGAKIAVLEGPLNEAVPFTARLRLPANYRIPGHWHPVTERVTVLSGTFYIGAGEVLDTTKGTAIPAGGFAVMPAKTPHFAYTTNEPVEFQLHSTGPSGTTYINPADDPRKKQ
ncbi:MAG TPA: cupin domain-containing protein [Ramlibacter sp.]|nr:cupin domain-containing protein [Ramlibacter sp.]